MEAIFSLWILVLSFLLIEAFFLVLTKGEGILQANEVNREFEIFVQELTFELYEANFSQVQVRGRSFRFMNAEGQQISYEWNGVRVRRQVNGAGNDIVLLNVSSFEARWDTMYRRLSIEVKMRGDNQVQRAEIPYITP